MSVRIVLLMSIIGALVASWSVPAAKADGLSDYLLEVERALSSAPADTIQTLVVDFSRVPPSLQGPLFESLVRAAAAGKWVSADSAEISLSLWQLILLPALPDFTEESLWGNQLLRSRFGFSAHAMLAVVPSAIVPIDGKIVKVEFGSAARALEPADERAGDLIELPLRASVTPNALAPSDSSFPKAREFRPADIQCRAALKKALRVRYRLVEQKWRGMRQY